MGIVHQMARLIVAEHAYKPIAGEFLLCGRQSVFLAPKDALKIVSDAKVLRPAIKPRLDESTRGGQGRGWISDESFFELFTDATLNAVDVSDYEGANIVHDMCTPVPQALHGRFNFMFNGSCMDNLANPAAFLANTSRMLAPGGVVMHIEHGSLARGAYLMYSADYFHDFYAVNRYADCKVYMALFEKSHREETWNVFQWYPGEGKGALPSMHTRTGAMIVTIAEKAAESTDDVFPIQAHYRPPGTDGVYKQMTKRFNASRRPVLKGGPPVRALPGMNFPHYCGSL